MSQLLKTRQISMAVVTFPTEQLRDILYTKTAIKGYETAENGIIFIRGRLIACEKQGETAPVVVELFTVEMTLGQTISRNPLRRLVGIMSRGRL